MSLSSILGPIEWVVSWLMVAFHTLLSPVFGEDSGWAWGLSIVGLVIVMRILLIPLFVKQIRSQRGLQLLQPEIKKIQAKYKNDREKQSQELMKLYRETGTNPLSSCLPILAQAPIFFALFRVLNGVAKEPPQTLGVLTESLARSAADATIFGAPIASTFLSPEGGDVTAVRIVTAVMIVLMSASTFITQKQLMTKNMPASAMDSPFAQQQKILLYVFPLIFAVTGVNFPIGVLIYWLTTNVWSMGQQLYVIQRMPAPGSVAEQARERRNAEKAARKGGGPAGPSGGSPSTPAGTVTEVSEPRPTGQRQQPRRKNRDRRRPSTGSGGTRAGRTDTGAGDGEGGPPAAAAS